MGKFKNCFWVDGDLQKNGKATKVTGGLDELKGLLWGIGPNHFNSDPEIKKCFLDLTTGRPAENKSVQEMLTDLIERPGETNLGIYCPDNTVKKLQVIRGEDESFYLQLSENPVMTPPKKPGPWKRFVNLFKKVKDPEVQRYHDWEKLESTAKNLKKFADRNARPAGGHEIIGKTIQEYKEDLAKPFWVLGNESEEKMDRQSRLDSERELMFDNAYDGLFGERGKEQEKFIRDNKDILHSGKNNLDADRARRYIASFVSLRLANDRDVPAEEYQKWDMNKMEDMVRMCEARVPLYNMLQTIEKDNGDQIIRTMNEVSKDRLKTATREQAAPEREKTQANPELSQPTNQL